MEQRTAQLNQLLDLIHPQNSGEAVEITIDQAIGLIHLTRSDPNGGGLWDDQRIVAALETLKEDPQYANRAYLVARRDRRLQPQGGTGGLRAVLGAGDAALANGNYPTLYMYRLTGRGWDEIPFWVPNVRFPDGQYALMFNFE